MEEAIVRARRRWGDNIKTDLKTAAYEVVDCVLLSQDWDRWLAVMSIVIKIIVP
jgi:hypothetical protein